MNRALEGVGEPSQLRDELRLNTCADVQLRAWPCGVMRIGVGDGGAYGPAAITALFRIRVIPCARDFPARRTAAAAPRSRFDTGHDREVGNPYHVNTDVSPTGRGTHQPCHPRFKRLMPFTERRRGC